jgi:uncharacterized protein YjbI with pentapeptide repeats
MANSEHLAKLKEGVASWNLWRSANCLIRPDLSHADVGRIDCEGANLSEVDFSFADLSGSNLSRADLHSAVLSHTDLEQARLANANLQSSRFKFANLRKADLSNSDCTDADFEAANLRFAVLRAARLRGANFYDAVLCDADCTTADFTNADLSGSLLLKSIMRSATLSRCRVYGTSVWDVVLEGAVQCNLVITPKSAPELQVDDLEVAQFVYLLLSRQKVRNVITTLGERAVLILGRFTERKELLERMADKLRSLGFLPIIFDFERPTDRDLTETIKILAGLSRFVIADITNPRSVSLELQATVPDYMVPFITIVERGQPVFGMFDDLPKKYHWALPLLEYDNPDRLLAAFEEMVVNAALDKALEVRLQKAAAPVRRRA